MLDICEHFACVKWFHQQTRNIRLEEWNCVLNSLFLATNPFCMMSIIHHSFLCWLTCIYPKVSFPVPVLYSLLHMTVLSWLTCHTVGFYPSCLTPIFTLSWFPVASLPNSTINAALVLTIFSIESGRAFWSNNKQCYNIQS